MREFAVGLSFVVLAVGAWCAEAAVPPGATVVAAAETNGALFAQVPYTNLQVHIEWKEPDYSNVKYAGWARGRALLHFGDFCALVFHDSYTPIESTYSAAAPDHLAGAVSDEHGPLVNASRPWETWQSFDVIFRPPRWEGTNLVFRGEMTVFLNGVLVQDKWQLEGGGSGRVRGTLRRPRDTKKMKLTFAPGWQVKMDIRNYWIREF